MVECQLPKLDVAGSSPVSRSIFCNDLHKPVFTLCSVCAPFTSPAGFSLTGSPSPAGFRPATAYRRFGSHRGYGRADRRPAFHPPRAPSSSVACVRRMTRKFAQPKTHLCQLWMHRPPPAIVLRERRHPLRRKHPGIIARFPPPSSRQFSISASSPSDRAALRIDWSVFGVSIAPRYTRCRISA